MEERTEVLMLMLIFGVEDGDGCVGGGLSGRMGPNGRYTIVLPKQAESQTKDIAGEIFSPKVVPK